MPHSGAGQVLDGLVADEWEAGQDCRSLAACSVQGVGSGVQLRFVSVIAT